MRDEEMNLQKAIQLVEEKILSNIFFSKGRPKSSVFRNDIWGISIDTKENIKTACQILINTAKTKIGAKVIPINYNCTLSYMAQQIGIELWQAMEIMKYAQNKGDRETLKRGKR